MKFIGRLKYDEIKILGLDGNSSYLSAYQKFLSYFFESFFSILFNQDIARESIPIIKSNRLLIFDNLNTNDVFFIFLNSKEVENQIEFRVTEDYRHGVPTLTRTMLNCEITDGDVLWGLAVSYTDLNDKTLTEKIVKDYLLKYK